MKGIADSAVSLLAFWEGGEGGVCVCECQGEGKLASKL